MKQETLEKFAGEIGNNFKQTEIGLIPEDWEVVRLREVSKYMKAGGTPRRSIKEYWNGDIPFVKIEDITSSGKYLLETKEKISKKGLDNSSAWLVPPNSILLSMYASIGEVTITKFPVATNQAILAIIPNEKTTVDFLYYCLKLHGKRLYSYIVQTTQKNVNKAITENLPIPLPPLEEQRKIARVLDKIQQAIEIQDRIIEQAKRLKKSLMQKLFTEGLYGEEQKETEIGLIPKSWEVVRLGELSEIKYGYRTSIPKISESNGIPIISMADITSEGQILWDNIRRIKVNQTIIQRHQLNDGEILFNWRNSPEHVGKTAIFRKIYSEPYICASFIIRIRTIESYLSSVFLHYQIMFMKINGYFAQKSRRAVGQTNFNASVLKNLPILLPPLEEQKQIAHILSVVDEKIEVEQKRKQVLKELFKTMLHKLMSGGIRLKEVEI